MSKSAINIKMWNKQDAEILKAKYQIAVDEGHETFHIMGQEVLVTFAKYLVQHLENEGFLSKD